MCLLLALKVFFFPPESKNAGHVREWDSFLNKFSCLYGMSLSRVRLKSARRAVNPPLLFSLQMTEGRLCQVQLLDDRKLELLVQVRAAAVSPDHSRGGSAIQERAGAGRTVVWVIIDCSAPGLGAPA